jgi:MFS transporter, PAT family, beta-lactamase induction signal transducer AmpG
MAVGQTTRSRLALFAGLYFAQGVPWGFFTVAIMLRMASMGLGPAAIGEIASTAWLPWTLKPLLGPLVDRVSFGRFGRRRPYILLAELGMALSLLAMSFVDPARSLGLFGVLLFAHNLFAAAQDVGTDALAIHILPPEERGSANGFMSAGKFAGVVVGGQGLLFVAHHAGWPIAYLTAIALLLVPALLVLPVRESDTADKPAPLLRDAVRLLSRRVVLVAAVFAVVVDAADSLLYPLMYPLLTKQLAFSEQQAATLATVSGAVSALASVAGGYLADRWGRRRTLVISCCGVAGVNLAFMLLRPLWGSYSVLMGYVVSGGIMSGLVYASTLALFMDLVHPRLAATQFQLYMALQNTRGFWGTRLGGWSAERLSPPRMFGLAAAIEVLPLVLLPYLDPRRAKTVANETEVRSPG